MNPRSRAAAVLALVLAPLGAGAGPPYATDDPEPVELRHWEVYAASQSTFGRGGFTGTAPHLEVNYGAGPGLQLHAIVPFVLAAGGGAPARWGPGDVELGAKVRFVTQERAGVQIGTFPLVTLPTGSSARGLGEGGATVFLPLWLQWTSGPWTTYGGGGFRVRTASGAADTWFLGWQAQRQVGPVAIGAEVFRETSSAGGLAGSNGFDVGAILDLSELHHLLASFGSGGGGDQDLHAYLGWQLTFGPREAERTTPPVMPVGAPSRPSGARPRRSGSPRRRARPRPAGPRRSSA